MHDGLVGDTFLIKFGLQIKHNTLVDFAASRRGIIGNEDQDSLFISTSMNMSNASHIRETSKYKPTQDVQNEQNTYP